ncbi:MAG: c-type cytochrome [Nitrospirota bacterium]
MSARIIGTVAGTVTRLAGAGAALLLLGAAEPPPQERDIRVPRVPADQLAAVRALVNPVPPGDETLERGKELFTAACAACHGAGGKGDGPLTQKTRIDPRPRNFTNPEFQRLRTDGELFWVLKRGSHDTEMMRMDFFFTDEELWTLVRYIRTLGASGPSAP